MTCIVGLVHNGIVYIGGDSAAITIDGVQFLRSDPKVFIKEDFLIGFTSSYRMGQLIRFNLKIIKNLQKKMFMNI